MFTMTLYNNTCTHTHIDDSSRRKESSSRDWSDRGQWSDHTATTINSSNRQEYKDNRRDLREEEEIFNYTVTPTTIVFYTYTYFKAFYYILKVYTIFLLINVIMNTLPSISTHTEIIIILSMVVALIYVVYRWQCMGYEYSNTFQAKLSQFFAVFDSLA